MDTICHCKNCYSRRFNSGPNSRIKYDDCQIQQALDYAFEQNRKALIALEEKLAWALYEGENNG